MAAGVRADRHHLSDRLPPWQFVGVVLVRADEYHRALCGRDAQAARVAGGLASRAPQSQNCGQLVHRAGGARPAEDDQAAIAGATDRVRDELAGVRG